MRPILLILLIIALPGCTISCGCTRTINTTNADAQGTPLRVVGTYTARHDLYLVTETKDGTRHTIRTNLGSGPLPVTGDTITVSHLAGNLYKIDTITPKQEKQP